MKTKKEKQRNLSERASVAVLAVIIVIALLPGCEKKQEPIRVGMATTLTGTASTWGASARNGVMLAVEEINKAGGINGRPIELLIRDDKADKAEALRVDKELIKEGVVAIIGHVYSTLTMSVRPVLSKENILVIALSTVKPEPAELRRNFLQVVLPLEKRAFHVANFSYKHANLRKVAVVYDTSNPKFTTTSFHHFKRQFETLGGEISGAVEFDPRKEFSAPSLAKEIMDSDAEAVFLLTNANHGALICQHLRMSGSEMKIIASVLSMADPNFISNGGKAVEGVLSLSNFNIESSNENFVDFKTRYDRRFGDRVSMMSQNGYEAAQILFSALLKTDDPGKLKAMALKQRVFNIFDEIIMEESGDLERQVFISEIKNGKIKIIGEFKE